MGQDLGTSSSMRKALRTLGTILVNIGSSQSKATNRSSYTCTLQYLDPSDYPRALQAFLRYHTRRAPFADYRKSWDYAEDPEIFWQLHFDDNIPLSTLAHRLFYTLANSVPCERNFSSMKVLHSKLRSRLTIERVNKLLYIQINRRTLKRDGKVRVLGDAENEEDEADTTEEEGEEAFAHIPAVQQGSEDVVMTSDDELGSLSLYSASLSGVLLNRLLIYVVRS